MTIETIIKELGRELLAAANELQESHSGDHATQQAHYAAAAAVRTVAETIGFVLIGTEDFRKEADKESIDKQENTHG